LAGREILVTLTDGTEIVAHDVTVSQETVSLLFEYLPDIFVTQSDCAAREIPTAEVKSVALASRGRGALDGLLVGLLGGTVGGALLSAAVSPDGGTYFSSGTEAAVFSGIVWGAVGGVSGVLYGAANGSTHVYEFMVSRVDTAEGGVRN
jgi:hypothetical protein